jgi:hypothetical protein
MATVALIACTKTKRQAASRAQLLYRSALYRKSLLYALTHADRHYILSAQHFLLSPETVISPYERTLSSFTQAEKVQWGIEVSVQLSRVVGKKDHLIMLCGKEYYAPIAGALRKIGCKISFPLLGLSLGNRLKALTKLNGELELEEAYDQFYKELRRLYIGQDGGRLLGTSTGRLSWPKRGVYFLMEPTEFLRTRRYSPLEHRVIRIGTHAVSRGSKTTLWDRLSTHRGIAGGGGSHRSSIYRLHVGAALAAKDSSLAQATWGQGQIVPPGAQISELGLEQEVSRYMSNVRVLWLDVPDEPSAHSDRAFIERYAIGVLSRHRIVTGEMSTGWLGNCSESVEIASSGLWNLNHLYLAPHSDFIRVFAYYVGSTLGEVSTPVAAIAPSSWYTIKSDTDSDQLTLAFDGSGGAANNS